MVNSSQVLIPTIAKKLSRSTFNLICSHVVIKSKGVFLKKEDFWRVSGNLARLFTNRLGIGMTWTCLGIFFEGSFPPSFKHSLAKKSINLQPHHRELNEERKIIKKGDIFSRTLDFDLPMTLSLDWYQCLHQVTSGVSLC